MSNAVLEKGPDLAAIRAQVELFLIEEAAMLDERRFDDWYALFTPTGTYKVPQAGAPDDANSAKTLFYIADDHGRLGERIKRMSKPDHHSEYPASICSRLIGNVRILPSDDGFIHAESRYITHRSKNNLTDVYCGHHRYLLTDAGGELRIAAKTTYINMNDLRPQGRVSIII